MRLVPQYEQKKRGCEYCLNKQMVLGYKGSRTACPFDSCPYHVLDKYETYEDFMESEDSVIKVTEFFSTIPGCYEMQCVARTPKRTFSDGDARAGI